MEGITIFGKCYITLRLGGKNTKYEVEFRTFLQGNVNGCYLYKRKASVEVNWILSEIQIMAKGHRLDSQLRKTSPCL